MRKSICFFILFSVCLFGSSSFSQSLNFKLPYAPGVIIGVSTGYGGSLEHRGNAYYSIDFNNSGTSDAGIDILAVESGTVVDVKKECFVANENDTQERKNEAAECGGGYGNRVYINHGNGIQSRYAHLQLGSISVSLGDGVVRGQHLGNLGTTGNSSGPHLHFEMRYYGGPYLAEPMSGYTNFHVGGIYLSENYPPNYLYDSTQTCEYLTGPDANWNYYCNNIKSSFDAWDDVQILSKFTNLVTDHRFKIEAYRNGYFAWDYATDWNYVGSGGWDHAYFYPSLYGAIPGSWSFNISIDDGTGFTQVDTVNVEVPLNKYYTFDWKQNCSYITGPTSNWHYYCGYPTNYYPSGWGVPVLIKLSDIYSDYRFKVYVYKNGVYQWTDTTDWTRVGAWGWNYSYFNPVIYDATVGAWNLYIYIDDSDDGIDNYDYLTYTQFYVF